MFSRRTHELCVLHAAKVSSAPVELTESHSTQNITICWNHPKSKNFRLIKKAPFEGWPLQKLIFHQTQRIIAASVVLGIYMSCLFTCVSDTIMSCKQYVTQILPCKTSHLSMCFPACLGNAFWMPGKNVNTCSWQSIMCTCTVQDLSTGLKDQMQRKMIVGSLLDKMPAPGLRRSSSRASFPARPSLC